MMDIKRKKELLESYKNRHPEMGVISYCCKKTGQVFLGISKDTKTAFNSINTKLAANWHPNKQLQELWNKYGWVYIGNGFHPWGAESRIYEHKTMGRIDSIQPLGV